MGQSLMGDNRQTALTFPLRSPVHDDAGHAGAAKQVDARDQDEGQVIYHQYAIEQCRHLR